MSGCGTCSPVFLEKHEDITPDDRAFAESFEQKTIQFIEQEKLIDPGDKVLVAVSGGKDSTALLHVLKKHGYPIEAVTIDAHIGCYTEKNLENIRKVCAQLDVKLHVIEFRERFGYSLCYMRDLLQEHGVNLKSCTICGVLRRYLINKAVREIGADKVATGHNLDDEAQSFFMNLVRNKMALNARLGPKPGLAKDRSFTPRIKPFYLTQEQEIIRYCKIKRFPVHFGRCPCSVEGFRSQIKEYLNKMEGQDPRIKENLVRALLDKLPALRARYKSEESIARCKTCLEPSKGDVCRSCQILDKVAQVQVKD